MLWEGEKWRYELDDVRHHCRQMQPPARCPHQRLVAVTLGGCASPATGRIAVAAADEVKLHTEEALKFLHACLELNGIARNAGWCHAPITVVIVAHAQPALDDSKLASSGATRRSTSALLSHLP